MKAFAWYSRGGFSQELYKLNMGSPGEKKNPRGLWTPQRHRRDKVDKNTLGRPRFREDWRPDSYAWGATQDAKERPHFTTDPNLEVGRRNELKKKKAPILVHKLETRILIKIKHDVNTLLLIKKKYYASPSKKKKICPDLPLMARYFAHWRGFLKC